MKVFRILLSVTLVAAVLMSMVLSANAYTYKVSGGATETKTTGTVGHTYVYDFKDSNGNLIAASNYTGHNGNASSNANTADGFKFVSGTGMSTGVGSNSFIHDMYLADDFYLGHTASTKMKMEAGHYYEVVVTFVRETNGFIGLCRSNTGKALNDTSTVLKQSAVATAGQVTTNTFILDGDTNGCAGNYLGICTQSGTTIIKKVTVIVYNKTAYATPASDKGVTINFDNGMRDIYLPNGEGQGYGKLEIVEDPNNSGRGNTLKITGTRPDGTTFLFGIPKAPGYGYYKGVNNNYLVTNEGFQVKQGERYRVSFDIYCEKVDEGISGGGYGIYLASKAGIGANGNKSGNLSKIGATGATTTTLKDNAGDGVWRHFECAVDANATSLDYTYLLIGLTSTYGDSNGNGYSSVIYIDNITYTNISDAPANSAKEVKRSIRSDSGSGDAYISAGLRFRGEIPTATADTAAEIGFVAAPKTYVDGFTGEGAWYDMTNGAPALDKAMAVNATDKLYGVNGSNNQYQLIITKLTKEGEATNLKHTYFNVVMYVKAADGTYTYYDLGHSCYNEVANVYLNNNVKF